MYVRQSDSENRPSRASAFNVRQTIEKRQLQQERRERRALRERIREQLRSLSEGRERKDSSSSHVSSVHSQNSVRSKSMSSLDQDQDDDRSESPLFKVQSSPTLEKEKEEVRSYLFGVSNLTESEEDSRTISPPPRHRYQHPKRASSSCSPHQHQSQEGEADLKHPKSWQWAQSWNALKTDHEVVDTRRGRVSKSVESVQLGDQESVYSSSISSVSSIPWWKEHRLQQSGQSQKESPEPVHVCGADQVSSTPVTNWDEPYDKEEDSPSTPIPPPRRHRLSLSAGQITLEEDEKPSWIRLAKERRSLRTARQVDQLSDRASTANTEPEWVSRARKKLESLNVTLTSTTDFNCGSSCITESSSAWSRGGLDALDDLRDEASRIGEELAEEATARLNEELGLPHNSPKMLEHTPTSRDPSVERPRVSFDASATEASDGDSTTTRRLRTRRSQKEEVRFGDLKHDWGGAQTKTKAGNGKVKEMRFGEVQVKETPVEECVKEQETRYRDSVVSATSQKAQTATESVTEKRPVMRFGDTPLDLFPNGGPRGNTSSSKFESVAGPDPTKMTAEQLNQNVEEYDFPIPTGKEDASELMKFLEDSLKKVEVVPEVVCSGDDRPKPKSILKRRSVENVLQELKREEQSDWLQKVEHRKSASFDWDRVGKGGEAGLDTTHTKTHVHTHTKTHTTQSDGTHKPVQDQHDTPSLSTPTTTTTSTFTATNASFFNVKLRHVSPNSRQPASTNDSLRFHTEQSIHRRTQGVYMNGERHSGEFSSLTVLPSSIGRRERTRPLDQGGGSQGSSPASSLESLSDSRGSSPTTSQTTVTTMRVALCEASQEERQVVSRRIRVQEEHGKTENDCSTQDTPGHRVGLQVKLQRVQEPSAPAWATCRTGRAFTATERKGEGIPAPPAVTTSNENGDASTCDTVTSHIDIVHLASSYPVASDTTLSDTESGISAVTLCHTTTTSLNGDATSSTSVLHQFSLEGESGKVEGVGMFPKSIPNHTDEECEASSESNAGDTPLPSPQAPTHTTLAACPASHPLSITPAAEASEEEELPCSPPDHLTSHPTSHPTTASPPQQGGAPPTKAPQACRLPHDPQDDPARPPAKVFSFTFGPDQKTRPETTLRDMDGDSLAHLKRQKEAENMRRTEGAKIITVITNPNDICDSNRTIVNGHTTHLSSSIVNGHSTHSATSFSEQTSKIRSANKSFSDQVSEDFQGQTSSAPTKPARSKQSAVSVVVGGERRKGEDHEGISISLQPTVHQVRVEVVDEEGRKESQRRKEERRVEVTEEEARKESQRRKEERRMEGVDEEGRKESQRRKEERRVDLVDEEGRKESQRRKEERRVVEVIDEEARKESQRRKEERRRGSLLEWEALQRQRLEEEERNRINKNLSMKPVSAKIKELVKMHGSFMSSMFSRDKKTDINGTVDGKDDIVFKKMSPDIYQPQNKRDNIDKEVASVMRSPYMVKKIGSPAGMVDGSGHQESSQHLSRRDSPRRRSLTRRSPTRRSPTSTHRSPTPTRRSPTRRSLTRPSPTSRSPTSRSLTRRSPTRRSPTRKASPSPRRSRSRSRPSEEKKEQSSHRILTESNWGKGSAANRESLDRANLKLRSSISPSRRKKSNVTSSSPDRRRERSRDKISYPKSAEIIAQLPKISKTKVDSDSTPDTHTFSPPLPPRPVGIHEKSYSSSQHQVSGRGRSRSREKEKDKSSHGSFGYEKRGSPSRSSIKDPQHRKEWLNKMLTSISCNQTPATTTTTAPQENIIVSNITVSSSPTTRPVKKVNKINMHLPSDQTTATNSQENITVSQSPSRPVKKMNMPLSLSSEIVTPVPPARKSASPWIRQHEAVPPSEKCQYSSPVSPKSPKNLSPTSTINTAKSAPSSPYTTNTSSPSHTTKSASTENSAKSASSYTSYTTVSPLHTTKSPSSPSHTTKSASSPSHTTKSPSAPTHTTKSPSSPSYTTASSSPYATKSTLESLPLLADTSSPGTPTSASLVKDAVSQDLSVLLTGTRGPVSLSSILGDSSRSSSLTSTPLGSPCATPERMFRKEPSDPTSKLDIILETSAREDRKGRATATKEQKENINPSSPVNRYIESYKESCQKETPANSQASTFRSSFRYKEKNEDRFKALKKEEGEDENVQKTSACSWQPSSQIKPFTFGRPSVTLKAMSSGWENQKSSENSDHNKRETEATKLSPFSKKMSTDLTCITSRVSGERNSEDVKSDDSKRKSDNNIDSKRKSDSKCDNKWKSDSTIDGKRKSDKIADSKRKSDSNVDSKRKSDSSADSKRKSETSYLSRFSSERSSVRGSTPSDRDGGGPVSLSTILSKEAEKRNQTAEDPSSSFDFKPKLNFSEELNNITRNYRSDLSTKRNPPGKKNESSLYTKKVSENIYEEIPARKENRMQSRNSELQVKGTSPTRDLRRTSEAKTKNERSLGRRSKEASPSPSPPKAPPKSSAPGTSQPKTHRVQRNSSLKRNRQEELRSSMRVKKERKDSEEDPGAIQDETVVQDGAGWTRTKTTVRRARLGSGDKARQIVRTNSGKTKKEKNFKANASQALESWAAGTSVQGKLVKKEGQRFSHESEEEVRGGQRTAKSVVRRVVRRGSRRLSGGGELLTETKETSTAGAAKDGKNAAEESRDGEEGVLVKQDDGVSRRMKTSTDGERYVTHSVSDRDGATTYTTQGVNNKTTTSVEVIGGDDFAGRRAVEGKSGERLVVERTQDLFGRPSTVVKKITSQSRVIITKTKRKSPVMV